GRRLEPRLVHPVAARQAARRCDARGARERHRRARRRERRVARPPGGPVIAKVATVNHRALVNLDLVRWHLVASAAFLVVSLLGGLAYAFQFNGLYPFEGVEWLSPGRVRMVHTNMAAYG